MERKLFDGKVLHPEYWDNHMPEDAHINRPDIKLEYGHEVGCFKDNLENAVDLISMAQQKYKEGLCPLRSVNTKGEILPLDCYFPGTVIRFIKEAHFSRGANLYRRFEQYGVILKAETFENGSWNYMDYYSPSDTLLAFHEIGNLKPVEIGATKHVRKDSQYNPNEFRLERVLSAELLTLGRAREVQLEPGKSEKITANPVGKLITRFKRR